eukprot:UN01180
MDVVNQIYTGYGEGAPNGHGPSQGALSEKGNAYLKEKFPLLSIINSVTMITDEPNIVIEMRKTP